MTHISNHTVPHYTFYVHQHYHFQSELLIRILSLRVLHEKRGNSDSPTREVILIPRQGKKFWFNGRGSNADSPTREVILASRQGKKFRFNDKGSNAGSLTGEVMLTPGERKKYWFYLTKRKINRGKEWGSHIRADKLKSVESFKMFLNILSCCGRGDGVVDRVRESVWVTRGGGWGWLNLRTRSDFVGQT